jgi:hypothetical protein
MRQNADDRPRASTPSDEDKMDDLHEQEPDADVDVLVELTSLLFRSR